MIVSVSLVEYACGDDDDDDDEEEEEEEERYSATCCKYLCFSQKLQAVNDVIYLQTAIRLTSGGSSTVHIYTQTIHRTTQITTEQHK
jgi:hypothetical protein